MTAIVTQAVVTDYCLGINSRHAVSRLYQATLMIYIYIYIYIYIIWSGKAGHGFDILGINLLVK